MPEITIDRKKVLELKAKFAHNRPAQKYRVSYEELLQLVSPANPTAMLDLRKRLNVSKQMAHQFYKRWIGPVYPGLATPGQLSKQQTKIRLSQRLEPNNLKQVPLRLRKIWRLAKALKFHTSLIEKQGFISCTNLVINGYNCVVKQRKTETIIASHSYITFHVNVADLNKFEFILLDWANERFIPCIYILPSAKLAATKNAGAGSYTYYIPLDSDCQRGHRTSLQWVEYRDNWDLLATAG